MYKTCRHLEYGSGHYAIEDAHPRLSEPICLCQISAGDLGKGRPLEVSSGSLGRQGPEELYENTCTLALEFDWL